MQLWAATASKPAFRCAAGVGADGVQLSAWIASPGGTGRAIGMRGFRCGGAEWAHFYQGGFGRWGLRVALVDVRARSGVAWWERSVFAGEWVGWWLVGAARCG